jgi:threonine dehydrogenase-like Zn-dependent dehydrogenase
MQALVFHGPGDVGTAELDLPAVGATDVVLAVEACGVCGSDLSSYAHGHYVEAGQVMGHEMSAVVVEHGTGLPDLSIGQRVAVRPMRSCDACAYCLAGDTHLCGSTYGRSLGYGAPGGFAERLHLADVTVGRDIVPVADDVDPFDLLWAEPLAVALHALGLAGGTTVTRLLVTGAGAVGLSVVAAAVAERREAARSLGAGAWAPGQLAADASYDALVDASGVPVALQSAVPLLHPTAAVILVGLNDAPVPWPVGAHRVTGAFGYRDRDFERAVELIADGRVSLGGLVPHRFGLAQADRALTVPRPQDNVVKAAIVPGQEP